MQPQSSSICAAPGRLLHTPEKDVKGFWFYAGKSQIRSQDLRFGFYARENSAGVESAGRSQDCRPGEYQDGLDPGAMEAMTSWWGHGRGWARIAGLMTQCHEMSPRRETSLKSHAM